MDLEQIISRYQPEMIRDLQALINIPSTRDDSTADAGAPFGREVKNALDWYLARAEGMGFKVKNLQGYAGHVEYGEGEELLGILAHLDVVPAGEGWQHQPFAAEIEDNKLYGRGVNDNKGPAILALYALKALKDNGIVPNKRIRIIVGCDEESGMECVKYYFQHEEKPTMGFSPDADFPLIHAEKGILHLKATWQDEDINLSISGGERPNVVPPKAIAQFSTGITLANVTNFSPALAVQSNQAGSQIVATGTAAHASVPQKGDNAIAKLLEFLSQQEVGGHAGKFEFLARAGHGLHGEGLNIPLEDEVSGKLTCNLGMIKLSQGHGEAVFDVRSPVTIPLETTLNLAKASLEQAGFQVDVLTFDPAHYVPKDSGLVQTLLKVYRQYTGDVSDAFAIGGGTYARKLPGAVAFGPLLPNRPDVAHIADEYMSIDDLSLCFKIYTTAIIELVTG